MTRLAGKALGEYLAITLMSTLIRGDTHRSRVYAGVQCVVTSTFI